MTRIKKSMVTGHLLSATLLGFLLIPLISNESQAESQTEIQDQTPVSNGPPTAKENSQLKTTATPGFEASADFVIEHTSSLLRFAAERAETGKMKLSEYFNSPQFKQDYERFSDNINQEVQVLIKQSDKQSPAAEAVRESAERIGLTPDDFSLMLTEAQSNAEKLGLSFQEYVDNGTYRKDLNLLQQKVSVVGQNLSAAAESNGLTKEEFLNTMDTALAKVRETKVSMMQYIQSGELAKDSKKLGQRAGIFSNEAKESAKSLLKKTSESISSKIKTVKEKIKTRLESPSAPTEEVETK